MERGDTGLGRDAYGPPRHERDRRGYGPAPYPPVSFDTRRYQKNTTVNYLIVCN